MYWSKVYGSVSIIYSEFELVLGLNKGQKQMISKIKKAPVNNRGL